jgi:hypothetical protein
MQQMEQRVGGLKLRVRDRKRSVRKRVIAIAYALRHKAPEGNRSDKENIANCCG